MEQSTSSHQQSQKLSCLSKPIEDVKEHSTELIPKECFEDVVQEDEKKAAEVC